MKACAPPSRWIRYRTIEGGVVILDVRRGDYVLFDPVASQMWNAIVRVADDEPNIGDLASRFGISASRCEEDLKEFILNCERRKFLRSADDPIVPSPQPVRYRAPNVLNAWKSLRTTRHNLDQAGFGAVYPLHCQMQRAERSRDENLGLTAALQAFSRAENFFRTRDARVDCLPRSLALHRFLIAGGFDVHHCLGVQRFPFNAHAWVVAGDQVLCDSQTFVNQFKEISRI